MTNSFIRAISSLEELKQVEITSFKDAIRLKCYDCSCYDLNEVKHCTAYSCPLWAFRLGKKPKEGRLKAVESAKENSL